MDWLSFFTRLQAMASARGTKRALDEPPVEEPEDGEPESSDESGNEPFAEGPASDLFSPSKEQAKSKPNLPQRVAYIDRPIMIAGELHETAVLCSLPHARAGAPLIGAFPPHHVLGKAQYIVQKGAVLEVHRVRRDPGSWFASDAVIEGALANHIHHLTGADGSLYLATEVDPLFVMIPILEKSRKKVPWLFPTWPEPHRMTRGKASSPRCRKSSPRTSSSAQGCNTL